MTRLFFRKTALGTQEIANRTLGLPRALRTLLILVAPQVSADELTQRVASDAVPMLESLQAMGLIEPAVPVARAPAAAAPPVAPPPPSPAAAAAPDLRAAKSLALVELAPVFGPEVDSILGGLLAADSSTALATELDALRDKLVMYQGRRRADALIRKISDAS